MDRIENDWRYTLLLKMRIYFKDGVSRELRWPVCAEIREFMKTHISLQLNGVVPRARIEQSEDRQVVSSAAAGVHRLFETKSLLAKSDFAMEFGKLGFKVMGVKIQPRPNAFISYTLKDEYSVHPEAWSEVSQLETPRGN